MNLITPNLKLLSCPLPAIEAILKGDAELAVFFKLNIPGQWTEFGAPAFRWTEEKLKADPAEQKWLTYLPVLKKDNMLIGSCGYKGRPNQQGIVEIGYEVAKDYRGRGYGKEIATALIRNAFADNTVTKIIAHTLAEENASVSILKHCGMHKTALIDDPEDGMIWRWELVRNEKK